MERVQKVSEKAREDVEPKKPTGPQINLDDTEEEKPQKTVKNAVSAIQRIGATINGLTSTRMRAAHAA